MSECIINVISVPFCEDALIIGSKIFFFTDGGKKFGLQNFGKKKKKRRV